MSKKKLRKLVDKLMKTVASQHKELVKLRTKRSLNETAFRALLPKT